MRLLHTMLRVRQSRTLFGFLSKRNEHATAAPPRDYPEGRFTLAFVGLWR